MQVFAHVIMNLVCAEAWTSAGYQSDSYNYSDAASFHANRIATRRKLNKLMGR